MLSIFSCAFWPSVCLVWRNVYFRSSVHFSIGLFCCCMNYLYNLAIKPLLVSSFANIFSNSVGCLFVSFMVSFGIPRLVSLIRSHLFIFIFISVALGDWSREILIWFMSETILLTFSSGIFMVLISKMFKPLSHFEFISVYGERLCSNFIDLYVAVQLSQHHLKKIFIFIYLFLWHVGSWLQQAKS